MKTNKGNEGNKHRYISYFQSVLTIGVMTSGKNEVEAEKKAVEKMKDKKGINYCIFDQTNFELTDTEEYRPEFETDLAPEGGLKINFNPDKNTRNVIATRLGKEVENMTDEDIETFIKQSIEEKIHGVDTAKNG